LTNFGSYGPEALPEQGFDPEQGGAYVKAGDVLYMLAAAVWPQDPER
jgi:hypothetical protein